MNLEKKHILITGAAGFVAGMLRSHWGDCYRLRLADLQPVKDTHQFEEYIRLDITALDPFVEACRGIDTVVHLAADRSPAAGFYETLLSLNIIGAYNAFEAARIAGCRRIVFASSINAVLGYGEAKELCTPQMPVYPINVYGATKCWGEALARVYAHEHGLSCLCVRLASPRFRQGKEWGLEGWNEKISPRDTAQLFRKCIDADESVTFAIAHGVSGHKRCWMDIESTRAAIGYEPEDGTAFPRSVG